MWLWLNNQNQATISREIGWPLSNKYMQWLFSGQQFRRDHMSGHCRRRGCLTWQRDSCLYVGSTIIQLLWEARERDPKQKGTRIARQKTHASKGWMLKELIYENNTIKVKRLYMLVMKEKVRKGGNETWRDIKKDRGWAGFAGTVLSGPHQFPLCWPTFSLDFI